MKVVKPRTVLPSNVTATNLQLKNPIWSSATGYSIGDLVDVTNDDYTYQCIQNNVNQNPYDGVSVNSVYWRRYSLNNKYAAFDQQVSTVSVGPVGSLLNTITYTINLVETFDTVAFFNLSGKSVQVTVTSPSVSYNSGEVALDDVLISDWYDYFFGEIVETSEIVLNNIPPTLGSSTMTITIKSRDNVAAEVGTIVVGSQFFIGHTSYGTSVGIIDYSKKETDEFGNTTFVRRSFSKRVNSPVEVSAGSVGKVQKLLSELRATPCVWIGDESDTYKTALTVYGFYRDFSIAIQYPSYSICELEIEGLT